jgi:hypothetical protein
MVCFVFLAKLNEINQNIAFAVRVGGLLVSFAMVWRRQNN